MDQRPPGSPNGPEMERAEQLVDLMGQTIAGWASSASLWLLRGTARAREEAEDMWAEAQSMRDEEQP